MTEKQTRHFKNQLLEGLQKMSKMNNIINDTHGNLSVKFDDTVFIKPSGVPYEDITLSDICEVSLSQPNSENKEARLKSLKPSVDTVHHIKIYKNHPWVNSICHTHSPYCVAFSAVADELLCYTTEQADYFGGPVEILLYADFDNWGDKVKIKEGTRAIILENHGVLTFGKDPNEAVKFAAALENVARKNYLIEVLGSGLANPLQQSEIDKWHKRYINDYGQKDTNS